MSGADDLSEFERQLCSLQQELAGLRATQQRRQGGQDSLDALALQLAGIIHSAMDGMITIDERQHVVLFNVAAEHIFRCSAREALGKPLDQFLPHSLRQIHQIHINQFSKSGATSRRMQPYREVKGIRCTGEEFPMEASISQFECAGKKWFTVILRDITDRKVQEDQIFQLGQILDDSFNEVYVFDGRSLRFTLVNRTARENTGYLKNELLELTPLDVMPEMTGEGLESMIHSLKQEQNRRIDFRTIQRRKNGSTYPVEVDLQYLPRKEGGLVVAILLDLTELDKTNHQLQETKRTLSTLLTNLPGMVYRCRLDKNRAMEFVSPSCVSLTGYSVEAFQSGQVSFGKDVICREDDRRVQGEISQALQARRPFQLSYRIRTADGVTKCVWEQGCGVFSAGGEVLALEGYIIDVTQERQLEDQLRKAERLAELGTLASGMAHEIGTPMNVILGRAELLMRKAKDESTRKKLETIVTQVERITKIMNQLLSFARKRPSERRAVDLGQVVTDVLDVLQEKLHKQHIQVLRGDSRSLPRAWADPDQMNQVLLNLLLNACQAMPNGGTLTIGLRVSEGVMELSIRDTGCGMTEEQMKKVFDPFFTTKAVGEGTGLGLTVVHGIVQEHDGAIRVTSSPGKGTTFFVSLPLANERRSLPD